MTIRPEPDVLYTCSCDPESPMCACLPLWAEPATHENEPEKVDE